jgi:hypothetical protein
MRRTTKKNRISLIPLERIEGAILEMRGERVMLDRDLARIYGVTTKALHQAVKRSRDRFPPGFMFELSPEEKDELVTNCDRFAALKHSSDLPYAFCEHGPYRLSVGEGELSVAGEVKRRDGCGIRVIQVR